MGSGPIEQRLQRVDLRSVERVLIGQYAEQVRVEAGNWLSTVRVAVTESHKSRREPDRFFCTYLQLASDETVT